MKRIGKILALACVLFTFPSQAQQRGFPYPSIPDSLKTPEARASYLAIHFWDNVFFSENAAVKDGCMTIDASKLSGQRFMEQGIVDFLSIFPSVPAESLDQAVQLLMSRAESSPKAHETLAGLAEKYLFEADSPMFNEGHFLLFAKSLALSGMLDEVRKERYSMLVNLMSLNNAGTKAANFSFIDKKGRQGSLDGLKAKKLLMIFYDPGCGHCMEAIDQLKSSEGIAAMVKKRKLKVLAVFADGEEEYWDDSAIPEEWLSVLDISGVQENSLYFLNSLPSAYLLDRDKTVTARYGGNQIADLKSAIQTD